MRIFQEIALKAFPDYRLKEPLWEGSTIDGVPEIGTVVVKLVEEWGTRLAMMEAGDADTLDHEIAFASQIDPMIKTKYTYQDGEWIEEEVNPDGILTLYTAMPGTQVDDIFLNFNIPTEGGNPYIGSGQLDGLGIPPDFFSDIHVRKAFNYCFDRETFIEDVLQGQGIPRRGPINLGGEIACNALAEAIDGTGKVYIQNVKPGISTTDQREEGCKNALANYPDIELVGVDYNEDDPSKAQAQTEATLQRVPDLAGIFGTNVFSAQGAGTVVANKGLGDQVPVVAFDATETAIEQLRADVVDLVIAQIQADMGYLAVIMANAYLNGVVSIPKRIPTGYVVITRDNVDDPNVAKYIYTAGESTAENMSAGRKVGFLAGVEDPFYFTMQRGAQLAPDRFGNELVVQIPDNWNATVQTPMLEAMVARGDLNFLFLAPVDKEAMIAPLQAAYASGCLC